MTKQHLQLSLRAAGVLLLLTVVFALPPLAENRVEIAVRDGYRTITANGIPDHETGQFPTRGNPNTIREQRYSFRVPANPAPAAQPSRLRMQPFGVALNGVPFDPGAAEWWDDDPQSGWQYEALSGKVNLGIDSNNAHVQPNGAYHYHGLPQGLIRKRGDSSKMLLIGYAADGFPIYFEPGARSSYRVKSGTRTSGPGGAYDGTFVEDWEYRAGSGDLDECNGRTSATPENPDGIYHYVVTAQFPFVPRFYRGTPDPSFERRGPGGPRGPRPPGPPPRRRPPA
jgi:hypothetical protein